MTDTIKFWIARDEDGTLCYFYDEPAKEEERGYWEGEGYNFDLCDFPNVKWTDERAHILELKAIEQ